jgi:hypothetical protein
MVETSALTTPTLGQLRTVNDDKYLEIYNGTNWTLVSKENLSMIQNLLTELEMAHQAEENAFRNRDAAIAENEQLKQKIERLEAICACAYQMAGAYDAPVRFLDALAFHDEYMAMTPDQIIDALLPVIVETTHNECDCSGRIFGAHREDCEVKNGKYTMRVEKK